MVFETERPAGRSSLSASGCGYYHYSNGFIIHQNLLNHDYCSLSFFQFLHKVVYWLQHCQLKDWLWSSTPNLVWKSWRKVSGFDEERTIKKQRIWFMFFFVCLWLWKPCLLRMAKVMGCFFVKINNTLVSSEKSGNPWLDFFFISG